MTGLPGAALASGLYTGRVTHSRLAPRRHKLRYRVFYMLLDLDELEGLDRGLRLFSSGGFNLLSFHEGDHLDGGTGEPLRHRVERLVERAGITLAGGAVRLLCMPRMLGHAFNPLSVYFCHDRTGALACMLYEVNNTFGQRHTYLIPVEPQAWREGVLHQACAKRFFVSPLMDMDLSYSFRIEPPGTAVTIGVVARDADGPVLATAYTGVRRTLSDRAILAAVLAHPLLSAKVLAAIHWEALRTWLKGVALRARPAPPHDPVTTVAPTRRSAETSPS